MGSRGPLPKRDEARAGHRSKAEHADKFTIPEAVNAPEADPTWHAQAREFWDALLASGQIRFYEPTDWALAFMRCRIQSVLEFALDENRLPSSSLLGELSKIDARLGISESDRRRMRMEVERPEGGASPVATDDAVDAIMQRYQAVAES